MSLLKLLALDADDLTVLSAHVQDAVLRVADISFRPRESRLIVMLNRFDWAKAAADGARAKSHERHRAALRFEHVRGVQRHNIVQSAPDAVLALLAIQFEPGAEAPAGDVVLVFSGGGALRLDVDCIEAELRDLGAAWTTPNLPQHGGDT